MHQRGELSEEQQRAFEAANPDITIAFVQHAAAQFATLIEAGTPPDLMRVEAPDIPQLLARNLLLDLTPFFETSQLLKLKDLAPANDYYKANSPTDIGTGKIYGITKDWSPDFTLFAYTKAFDQAGVPLPDATKALTYAEVGQLAKALQEKDGSSAAQWAFAYPSEWIDRIMMNLLAEMGQQLYSDDFTRLNLTSNNDAVQIASYFVNLAQQGLTPSPLKPSQSWPGDDFQQGRLGLVQYGYWFSAIAESDTTRGDVVMLPAPTWSGTRLDPPMSATGMVMSRTSKSPEAAWRVFEWYNGGQPALDRSASGWGVPALLSQYERMPARTAFQQQVSTVLRGELQQSSKPLQFNPYLGGGTFGPIWAKHLETALRGGSVEQMLRSVESEVNAALEAGRKRFA